ncbi:hypothetical protein IMZ48_21380 [Candidatus Bathyarchaeota archaeon]|nr:hypothetical protein [Candidatus Bathyarchaeota archaeon]
MAALDRIAVLLTLPRTLGLDPGSTSTRVFLKSGDFEIAVGTQQQNDNCRYNAGEFSSSCYIFDNKGSCYLGNEVDNDRVATSIKPIFLLLSDIEASVLEPLMHQYPHGDKLLGLRKDRAFLKKLNKVLDAFFNTLRDRVLRVCNDHDLRITMAGIALPTQWPAEVEVFLGDVLQKTLLKTHALIRVPRGGIFFHGETQALGHCILKACAGKLLPRGTKSGTFLIADFGGQNLVSLAIVTLVYGPYLTNSSTLEHVHFLHTDLAYW